MVAPSMSSSRHCRRRSALALRVLAPDGDVVALYQNGLSKIFHRRLVTGSAGFSSLSPQTPDLTQPQDWRQSRALILDVGLATTF